MDERSTAPKPFVFVLMPFAAEFDDVYELGIKAACVEAGAHCERVDEQIYDGTVMERVYNQIAKADIIVADMSGRNANVFYETGYAHALGKRVVLLTHDAADIPFDMQHYPHIVYGGKIRELKVEVLRRILWFIQHPQSSGRAMGALEFFAARRPLEGARFVMDSASWGFIDVSVHNSGPVTSETVELGMVLCEPIKGFEVNDASGGEIELPDGGTLYSLDGISGIPPDAWRTFRLTFERAPTRTVPGRGRMTINIFERKEIEVVLRAFYDTGPKPYRFTIEFPASPERSEQAGDVE